DSLGIVLCQRVAGRPPFDGGSAQAILMHPATATPVPIRRVRRAVPGALGAVVDRTLAKDPAERFQTAEELSRALVEALPAAARDSVHVQSAWTALLGWGRAGCLVLGGLGAGACVLALSIFSKPPRIQAS